MVDFFDKLFSITIRQKLLNKIKFNAVIHIIAALCSNIFVPFYFILTKNNNRYALKVGIENRGSYYCLLDINPNPYWKNLVGD